MMKLLLSVVKTFCYFGICKEEDLIAQNVYVESASDRVILCMCSRNMCWFSFQSGLASEALEVAQNFYER